MANSRGKIVEPVMPPTSGARRTVLYRMRGKKEMGWGGLDIKKGTV